MIDIKTRRFTPYVTDSFKLCLFCCIITMYIQSTNTLLKVLEHFSTLTKFQTCNQLFLLLNGSLLYSSEQFKAKRLYVIKMNYCKCKRIKIIEMLTNILNETLIAYIYAILYVTCTDLF